MPLFSGTRVGAYEIIAPLGAGGMGEVYRARDTKLNRDVALKVLPAAFMLDPDRLARFKREAQVLAALNHPHIGAIYGLEDSEGMQALVLELIEGPTLADRLQRGAMRADEALPLACQIAEALEAAHDQGIVHRDLKPANIKLTADDKVKVLDFGLAKAIEKTPASETVANSPTLSVLATQAGIIMGTAAYMSPEQAKGVETDRRSDVFSFGVVLYEMLTARQPFHGETAAEIMASVLIREPDLDALPANLHPRIRELITRCLDKQPKKRWQAMGDLRLELESLAAAPYATDAPPSMVFVRPPLWKRAVLPAATALVAGTLVAGAAWMLRPAPRVPPVVRFTFALGEGQQLTNLNMQSLGISADGTRIAYVANREVHVRSLSELEARPIAQTQSLVSPSTPVFSPDGQSIVFWAPMERAIKRIAVSGGTAATVCPTESSPMGMSWDGDDVLFGQGSMGILRVSANGGRPAVIAGVKSGEIAASPQMLPGGEWVLFTVATSPGADGWDKAQIVAQSVKTSERKTLVSGGSEGRYVPSGHLVYAVSGVLFAVPFDLRRLAVTGGPVSVVEGVRRASSGTFGTAFYAISPSGSLVLIPGPATASGGSSVLAFMDRATGAAEPLKLPPARYEHPRLSPDGKWIAVAADDGRDAMVSIVDVSGAASIRRLTLGARNRLPVWSPDGQYVTFQSDREGDLAIWRQRADGTAPAERLTKPDKGVAHLPESWSPDGKTLLFSVGNGARFTAAMLSLPDRTVTPFGSIQSSILFSAAFSPDGKWVAYEAKDATAPQAQLFVQPFPATGATYQIAQNGIHATWSRDAQELFYGPAGGQLVGVTVTTRPSFSFSPARSVPVRFLDAGPGSERNNDITPDNKRFLAVIPEGSVGAATPSAPPQIQVVVNWSEELKARVPTK